MTIETAIKEKLVSYGLLEEAAQEVFEAVKSDPSNAAMISRWEDDVEGYPPQIMVLAWFSAKQHALEWINTNRPLAWFRPMFADG